MATFKYELPEPVRVTADLKEAVALDDPRGVFTLDAGSLVDIDDAQRWGLTTADAELARADAPRKRCTKCGSAL